MTPRHITFAIIVVLLLIFTLIYSAVDALSQPVACGPRDKLEAHLSIKFGEARFAQAMSAGNAVNFYANSQSGSWTLVVVTPQGMACVMAAGQDFETAKPVEIKPGNPS